MLKLEATLIAKTAARPRPSGWSPEHGIDFIIFDPGQSGTVGAAIATARIATVEPVSFIEADEGLVRRYVSLAARAAEAATEEPAERPLTRAWSSVARKVPGS